MYKIEELSGVILQNLFLPIVIITIVVIGIFGSTGSTMRVNCQATAKICEDNSICEFTCKFPCCKYPVWGSSIYSSDSSICQSALHDLRISLHNETARTVRIRKFQMKNCTLESSVRSDSSSSSFQNESCNVFQFVSPRIKEDILDVVSMHSNYLYGENEMHVQVCATASNALDRKVTFDIYWKWKHCKSDSKVKKVGNEEEIHYKNIWLEEEFTAGFQCIPSRTDLSVITSIAFRRDASFLPVHFTVIANKKENITLSMTEVEENLDLRVIWKKDGNILNFSKKKRTTLTLLNVTESASGIYSLGYDNSDAKKLGFVQLIVRACPEGKFGDDCSMTCPDCLNGGICHDITGECLCAPGFNGTFCEGACLPGYIGKKCNIKCTGQSSDEELCKGLSICLPNPYGCSCASGFYGLHCDKECPDAYYGAGCLQLHPHKYPKVGTCSRFFNFCECEDGWHGTYCDQNAAMTINSTKPENITAEASFLLETSLDSHAVILGISLLLLILTIIVLIVFLRKRKNVKSCETPKIKFIPHKTIHPSPCCESELKSIRCKSQNDTIGNIYEDVTPRKFNNPRILDPLYENEVFTSFRSEGQSIPNEIKEEYSAETEAIYHEVNYETCLMSKKSQAKVNEEVAGNYIRNFQSNKIYGLEETVITIHTGESSSAIYKSLEGNVKRNFPTEEEYDKLQRF